MIDYILNVSVSIAAGVLNLASLFPVLSPYIVILDIALVLLMMILNLRGVRESGTIFALPSYFFVASAVAPITKLDRASIQSLAYARSFSSHVTAVHIAVSEEEINQMQSAWDKWPQHLREKQENESLRN